jgi:hypothetical protein
MPSEDDEYRQQQRPVPVEEVTRMGTVPVSAREALDMIRAGLGYLAAADPAQVPAATQAECLRDWSSTARWRRRRGPGSWPRSPRGMALPRTGTTAPCPG